MFNSKSTPLLDLLSIDFKYALGKLASSLFLIVEDEKYMFYGCFGPADLNET